MAAPVSFSRWFGSNLYDIPFSVPFKKSVRCAVLFWDLSFPQSL